jgi:hypothetical protein
MNIRIKKVPESSYKRQLRLAEKLEAFLEQVAGYKAIRKFHELLYEKPSNKDIKPFYNDLLKTDFRYYCQKMSYSDKFRFRFFHTEFRNDMLEFDIADKSIPAIRAGLDAHKARLIDWEKTSDEPRCPSYKIEELIRDSISGEYTRLGFDRQKEMLATALHQAADSIESLCYDNIESVES